MIIVDTHTHAGLNWFEPVDMLIHQMNLNGVEKAIINKKAAKASILPVMTARKV